MSGFKPRHEEWESHVDRLMQLREQALAANNGFQVQQAEALLDKALPSWRTYSKNANPEAAV